MIRLPAVRRLLFREAAIAVGVAAFFLCCYARLLATGHLELDDLGRVQIGYNLWASDGRLLTAGLMALLSFGGQMVDLSPLPQLGAIALMGAAGVLLARADPTLGIGRTVLATILLFATPYYLQNMSYVFDSLSMTAAVVLALWAALLVPRGARSWPPATASLLAALLFYQPAIDVFTAFAAAGVLFRLSRAPDRAWPEAIRAALVLLAASGIYAMLILVLRGTGLVVFYRYQTRHAALASPAALPGVLLANFHDMLALADRMLPVLSPSGIVSILLLGGLLVAALFRAPRRRLALAGACALLLLASFAGPMLLLRHPVIEPRTLLGIGAMVAAAFWTLVRLAPPGRPAQAIMALGLVLAIGFARDASAYGALLRDLDRAEAERLPPIARALNAEADRTGLSSLQILGSMPFPITVQHGFERAPVLAPLISRPVDGFAWFAVALLGQYGLEDRLKFHDAEAPATLCPLYRDTGAGYSITETGQSVVLMFRNGCP